MGSLARQGRKVVDIADRDLAWKDGATEMAAANAEAYSAGTLLAARIGMVFGFVVGLLSYATGAWMVSPPEPAQVDEWGER